MPFMTPVELDRAGMAFGEVGFSPSIGGLGKGEGRREKGKGDGTSGQLRFGGMSDASRLTTGSRACECGRSRGGQRGDLGQALPATEAVGMWMCIEVERGRSCDHVFMRTMEVEVRIG